ncbi:MAG: mercury methylation corrinoid protein HgcA [Proteobacteria bacterium]|nr:mercury methylation corrinoid protein HgcA [Pseudomonadota bacterium]
MITNKLTNLKPKCSCSGPSSTLLNTSMSINIQQTTAELGIVDHFTHLRLRLGISRYSKVDPGIYKVGNPDQDSLVFISANYVMSFNKLRNALKGMNAWIMVLDTKGINVWCAAGKGTFGTNELIKRITDVKLSEIVKHKIIIVPQLGAPGVSAHEVGKATNFKVIYGPVRAEDLKTFVNNGFKATKEMRQVNFNLTDRIVLIPVEIKMILKYAIAASLLFYFINHFGSNSNFINDVLIMLLLAIVSGTILSPILLPFVPFRAFSLKGFLISLIAILAYIAYAGLTSPYLVAGSILLFPALSAFISLNFTGASTYTSVSGVRKEMRRYIPFIIGFLTVGFILITISLVRGI